MTLRIVHLGKYYHPHSGGIESHVRTLAQIQSEHGAEVHVVCMAHDRSSPNEFWDGPVYVRRFNPLFTAAKLDWLPGVSRYLDELNCDVLHVHVPNPAMTLAVLGMRTRKPLAVTYHSDVVGMQLRRWLFDPFHRRLFAKASVIGATNPRQAESSPNLQRYRKKVLVLPMGIPLDRFLKPTTSVLEHAERIKRRHPGPIWLMCGRLVPYKGHSIALQALAETLGTLIVIGDGPLRDKLRREADGLGLGSRVQFLGRVGDAEIDAHYRAATALWLPSILPSEAFGLVQVEAMASGCPVINTNLVGSGVPWVSLHGETGLTVPVGDPSAIAVMANRLIENPALCTHYSRMAKDRARSEFCQTVMYRRWLQAYEHCLNDSMRGWKPLFPLHHDSRKKEPFAALSSSTTSEVAAAFSVNR